MAIKETIVEDMHKAYLETLRHREQEILRYLVILGPAIGGFMWLFYSNVSVKVFTIGTVGAIILLLFGAIYSVVLGYHYRYIVILLAKIEVITETDTVVLKSWPRTPEKFIKKKHLFFWDIPWCEPPDIINIFYGAFIVGIIGVTVAACLYEPNISNKKVPSLLLIVVGAVCVLLGYLSHIYFGYKIRNLCKQEPEKWTVSGN